MNIGEVEFLCLDRKMKQEKRKNEASIIKQGINMPKTGQTMYRGFAFTTFTDVSQNLDFLLKLQQGLNLTEFSLAKT